MSIGKSAGQTQKLSHRVAQAQRQRQFSSIPAKTLDGLAKDRAALISMMSYHVLQGKIETTEFKEGPTKTVQGASLELYRAGPYVTVGEAMVTMADVEASNGVVQVIDRVLIPPTKK